MSGQSYQPSTGVSPTATLHRQAGASDSTKRFGMRPTKPPPSLTGGTRQSPASRSGSHPLIGGGQDPNTVELMGSAPGVPSQAARLPRREPPQPRTRSLDAESRPPVLTVNVNVGPALGLSSNSQSRLAGKVSSQPISSSPNSTRAPGPLVEKNHPRAPADVRGVPTPKNEQAKAVGHPSSLVSNGYSKAHDSNEDPFRKGPPRQTTAPRSSHDLSRTSNDLGTSSSRAAPSTAETRGGPLFTNRGRALNDYPGKKPSMASSTPGPHSTLDSDTRPLESVEDVESLLAVDGHSSASHSGQGIHTPSPPTPNTHDTGIAPGARSVATLKSPGRPKGARPPRSKTVTIVSPANRASSPSSSSADTESLPNRSGDTPDPPDPYSAVEPGKPDAAARKAKRRSLFPLPGGGAGARPEFVDNADEYSRVREAPSYQSPSSEASELNVTRNESSSADSMALSGSTLDDGDEKQRRIQSLEQQVRTLKEDKNVLIARLQFYDNDSRASTVTESVARSPGEAECGGQMGTTTQVQHWKNPAVVWPMVPVLLSAIAVWLGAAFLTKFSERPSRLIAWAFVHGPTIACFRRYGVEVNKVLEAERKKNEGEGEGEVNGTRQGWGSDRSWTEWWSTLSREDIGRAMSSKQDIWPTFWCEDFPQMIPSAIEIVSLWGFGVNLSLLYQTRDHPEQIPQVCQTIQDNVKALIQGMKNK